MSRKSAFFAEESNSSDAGGEGLENKGFCGSQDTLEKGLTFANERIEEIRNSMTNIYRY